MNLETVTTARLELPLWTAEDAVAVKSGLGPSNWHPHFPRKDDRDAASLWREGDPWGPRFVVHQHQVIGSIGFFGPPVPAPDGVLETEVGYGLVEGARGHGMATEALRALLTEADAVGVRVRASVSPDNATSIRVLAKCGFTELRGSNEDGELVMARPLK
jgi:ribosomal-protein-alanine N-acetyltransferase